MAAEAPPTRDNALAEGAGKIEGANGALRDRIGQALASSGIHLSKLPEKPVSAVPAVRRQALRTGINTPDPCDLIAIITQNTNPVSELTVDQVRKIFSGEYTNWIQAGGPDLPIKVITVQKQSGDLEKKIVDHIRAPLSKNAVRLPLVSLIIPVVAQTEGAVGFLPVLNTEQLDFVADHKAFKRIAIKAGDQDPALVPSRIAVNTSMYPIMHDIPQHRPLAASSVAAREITR
jgi:phosphate transport system substrate-binding protein